MIFSNLQTNFQVAKYLKYASSICKALELTFITELFNANAIQQDLNHTNAILWADSVIASQMLLAVDVTDALQELMGSGQKAA